MTNQNDGASNGGEPATGAPPTGEPQPENAIPSKPATEADLEQVKKQMSGFERSTLGWTRASFIVILATGIFIALQWHEMHSGGQDTHDLAVAAGKQADAASKQADRMKDQADRTKELVAAAKQSADTAHETLTRSVRPWVGVDSVHLTEPIGFIKAGDEKDPTYFVSGSIEITIKNYGSSPALSVKNFIEAYDPSMFMKEQFDPKDPFAPLRKFGESTCAIMANDRNEFSKKNPRVFGGAIFPTQTTVYTGGIAGFAKERAKGAQWIQLVGCTVYRDQFGEKLHHTHYCFVAPIGKTGTVNECESNSDAD
jgi:hypothetical protein